MGILSDRSDLSDESDRSDFVVIFYGGNYSYLFSEEAGGLIEEERIEDYYRCHCFHYGYGTGQHAGVVAPRALRVA